MSITEKLTKCINFIKSDEKLRNIIVEINKRGFDSKYAYVFDPLIQYDVMNVATKYIVRAPVYYDGANSGLAYDHEKYYGLLQLAFKCDKIDSLKWLASQGILMINNVPAIDGNFNEFSLRIIEIIKERHPDAVELDFSTIEEIDLLLPSESNFVKKFDENIRAKTQNITWSKPESANIDLRGLSRDDIFTQIIRNVIKHKTKHFIIFTDAACKSNGNQNCNTSWGFIPITPVFPEQKKCIGEITNCDKYDFMDKTKKQTNNRGELLAIYEALLFCLGKHDEWEIKDEQKFILIITDSEYSQKTLMEYYDNWIKNKVLAGKENLDIIMQIKCVMSMLEEKDYKIFIEHTKGHLQPITPLGSIESYIRHYNIIIDKFVSDLIR